MINAVRRGSAALLLGVLTVGFVGCGGDDNTKTMTDVPGGAGGMGSAGASTPKPTSNEEYQKRFSGPGNNPMATSKNYSK